MKDNKVMVVTPVYSTEDNKRLPLLLQTIYWVRNQTYKNKIHVIVDDGSTDRTPELLEEIASYDPSIMVFHRENGGSSSAVNFGIENALKRANPSFITIIHSDDILPPKSLESRVNLASNSGLKLVYSDMEVVYEKVQLKHLPRLICARDFSNAEEFYKFLLGHGYIPYPTMLWERDFFLNKVGGYDNRITSAEDWDIALRTAKGLMETGSRFAKLDEVSALYRIHDNNLGYRNIRDGTTWKCYKMILRKHLGGAQYRIRLVKLSLNFARALMPENIKRPLRYIRDSLLTSAPRILPYGDEFLEVIRAIDYEKQLAINKLNS